MFIYLLLVKHLTQKKKKFKLNAIYDAALSRDGYMAIHPPHACVSHLKKKKKKKGPTSIFFLFNLLYESLV